MWACQKCGETHDDSFETCWNCGTSKAGYEDPTFQKADDPQLDEQSWAERPAERDVPTHLVEAILVTLLCCVPFGIVAIVFAAQVSPKLTAGDYEGAKQASKSAETWVFVSLGVGLLAILIGLAAQMAGG
jgi:hypothetical protein